MSRSRARELQLKVADNNPELENLIWQAYLGIEQYMELRSPFNLQHHFLSNGGATAVAPVPALTLPPNTPQQYAINAWNLAIQNAIQAAAGNAIEVDYSIVNGLVESPRVASEFRTIGKVSGARVTSTQLQLSSIDTQADWRQVHKVSTGK